jgi:hypothetical protein
VPRANEARALAKRAQYADYKALCAERCVTPQRHRWWKHFDDLRNDDVWRPLTQLEHHAFWRNKFSDAEIIEMASGLEFLTSEGRG